jgi:hypothetical protein
MPPIPPHLRATRARRVIVHALLGLGLADTVPDANTIWTFREALTRARIGANPAIEVLFERFDAALLAVGFRAMSGQIIDASIVAASKQPTPTARSAPVSAFALRSNLRQERRVLVNLSRVEPSGVVRCRTMHGSQHRSLRADRQRGQFDILRENAPTPFHR